MGRWLAAPYALWVYLIVAGLLLLGSIVAPPAISAVMILAITALGIAAFGAGVRWHRPDVGAAWWLIFAGAILVAGAATVITEGFAITGSFRSNEAFTGIIAAASYPLFIAGLALLARLAGQAEAADMLDATVIALATFLLLFSLVINPVLPPGGGSVAAAIAFSLGSLLVFAMTVRVALSVGIPTVALGLLLLAVCAFAATSVSVLVPVLTTGALQSSPATLPLWTAYSVLLGAAGLHPSLRATRYRRQRRHRTTSKRRMLLFAVLAVIAPLALAGEVRAVTGTAFDLGGLAFPFLVSGVLLVLLVVRLGLIAGVAERRAAELSQRSRDLAAAVREQDGLHRQLRYQALHDPLTGLANRVRFTERMEWALTRPAGSREHAVAIIDLDHFKDVNDTLGHAVGDEVLVEVSQRLLGTMPAGGTLARLGGDEFAALLEDTPAEEAKAWAERVRASLRRPHQVAGHDFFLSASVGLVTTDPAEPSPTTAEVLRDADLALHAAKAAGRNRVVGFRPELRTARMEWNRLHTGLRRAIADNQLAVFYQPIVNLITGQIVVVEALLRWEPPGRAAVSPSEFIPVAEETNLIIPLGAGVMRQACLDARRWFRDQGVAVAVNVSARQLDDPGFADMVDRALRDADLPGQALIIEITESNLVATSTATAAINHLHRLRARGVRIAIDDFGTGYSSLAYIARLPADIVKIDSSFVKHPEARPGTGGQDWSFTRAILHMVDALNLEAVAEGVETLAQAEALRELKCPLAQGFLFAKPMPRELLEQALAATREGASGS